ncbi:MAG TPA: hypothetical protein VKH34_12965 [Vicinamibacterales bacterium]|nr:hypothetical protein [Vicinamibacterales bacterium]
MRWYREHGYQFLVLTDHNFLASATYEIKGDEGYVRARVIGSNGRMAWAQPTVVPGRAASGRD